TQEGAPVSATPLVLRWADPDAPLPVRPIRPLSRPGRGRVLGTDAPPWLPTGPADKPFDFCGHVRRLCVDVVTQCEALRHIDVSRILFSVIQARSGRSRGLQARVTFLRSRNGSLTHQRRGVAYQVQRYVVDGREMLYLVTFCLPRFLDQDFDD